MEALINQTMENKDFTTTVLVNETPEDVFAAINNIRGWWSEDVDGSTDMPHHEFLYRDKHLWSRMKITELTPAKKVVWQVVESQMDNFEGGREWNGTSLVFDISKKGEKTQIRFTHSGLTPQCECYAVCSNSWNFYINHSLRNVITTGKGEPIKKG
jgi:uncharacterized protein YndB with AHSA1/START domain